MVENVEVNERLDLIRQAVLKLEQTLSHRDFTALTGFIEALCRNRHLSVSTVDIPAILQQHTSER